MMVNLINATVRDLAQALFDHSASEGEEPWYSGDIDFRIEPARQLRLMADLFHHSPDHFKDYPEPQVEQGLWCMMGSLHNEAFCGLIWDPALPLPARLAVVDGIYPLYDHVLARYPYEAIGFRHPDDDLRRFRTIDYMATDLLLKAAWIPHKDEVDAAAVRTAFLGVFTNLLAHEAPVAQYAALHGLGHLDHDGRAAVIDDYLATHTWLDPEQRDYATEARRGDVL